MARKVEPSLFLGSSPRTGCARGDTAEVFEFVEEALDHVPRLIQMRAEHDRLLAARSRRDIGEHALLVQLAAKGAGIIGLVRQQHRPGADPVEHLVGGLDVMSLAWRDGQPYRQSGSVGESMDFCCKTAPASSKTTIRVAFFKVAAE